MTQRWVRRVKRKRRRERLRPVRDLQMTLRDEHPDWRVGKIDGIVGVKRDR